jgi:Acyl-CoA carboxylase epsilon subunit
VSDQPSATTDGQPSATTSGRPTQPTLRLVRGDAGPEELAALLAVLSARGTGVAETGPPARPRGRWGDPASAVQGTLHAGPGGWRASGLPR